MSLVIPAHNEAANIGGVIHDCLPVLASLSPNWEIILVDDGSTDQTVEEARRAMNGAIGRLRIIRHARKLGYGLTVGDGLRAASGAYVAFMDGDGQFDPLDLSRLAALMPSADLATGWRRQRADPRFRSIISGVFNLLVRAMYGVHVHDIDCGLKLMRRSVLDIAMPLLARSALLNTELFFKVGKSGLRTRQIPVSHLPRTAGVRSGARLIPILRAVRDLAWLRLQLLWRWRPVVAVGPAPENF